MTKEPKTYNGEKKASSINGADKIGKPHTKEWNYITVCPHVQKLIQKCIKDPHIRSETINYVEENRC